MEKQSNIVRFNVLSSDLFKRVEVLSGFFSSKPVLPILGDFLFELTETSLAVTASDLSNAVVTTLPVKATGASKIAIPASILIDTLRNLPPQPIEVEINAAHHEAVIIAQNGRFKIACENHVDFPQVTQLEEAGIAINVGEFKKAIKQTLFAASKKNEMHPQICGLNITLNPDKGLTFVTTDGFRLVRHHINHEIKTAYQSFTLQSKSMQLLLQLLPSGEKEMQMVIVDKKKIHFKVAHLYIMVNIMEGTYPDYTRVIPAQLPHELRVNREAFYNAIKIIDCYANKTTYEICLKFSKDELKIAAEDLEFANKGETTLTCAYEGPDTYIGMNSTLLLEMVKNMQAEVVVLHFDKPQNAMVVTPAEEGKDTTLLMLIVPITLRKEI